MNATRESNHVIWREAGSSILQINSGLGVHDLLESISLLQNIIYIFSVVNPQFSISGQKGDHARF